MLELSKAEEEHLEKRDIVEMLKLECEEAELRLRLRELKAQFDE